MQEQHRLSWRQDCVLFKFSAVFSVAEEIKICYHTRMRTPTIVKTTKDYMLVKIPFPHEARMSRYALANHRKELNAEDVLQIVAEGERSYRRGKIRSIRS